MYVTAHRVTDKGGHAEINGFLYSHEGADWDVPPCGIPDERPGKLIRQSVPLLPGGNDVSSFLDVVAPDGEAWSDIERCFATFVAGAHGQPLPWVGVVGRCLFRFGLNMGLAPRWRSELAHLYQAVESLAVSDRASTPS